MLGPVEDDLVVEYFEFGGGTLGDCLVVDGCGRSGFEQLLV